jgi:hypothetical protein
MTVQKTSIDIAKTMINKNLEIIFGHRKIGNLADFLTEDPSLFISPRSFETYGEIGFIPRGKNDALVLCDKHGTPMSLTYAVKEGTSSCLKFVFCNDNYDQEKFNKAVSQNKIVDLSGFTELQFAVDINWLMMREFQKVKYFLYRIYFQNRSETKLDKKTLARLAQGYVGITSRNIVIRFNEHLRHAKNNTGSMLHSVWHSMMGYEEIVPRLELLGIGGDLDFIYQMEEETVALATLAPLGLNAIPGGWAGIKMLHTLGLTNKRKIKLITPEDRDEALTKLERLNHPHGSPCCHYRRGHIRKLSETRHTYVTGHFVNADKEVINEEADSNVVLA